MDESSIYGTLLGLTENDDDGDLTGVSEGFSVR